MKQKYNRKKVMYLPSWYHSHTRGNMIKRRLDILFDLCDLGNASWTVPYSLPYERSDFYHSISPYISCHVSNPDPSMPPLTTTETFLHQHCLHLHSPVSGFFYNTHRSFFRWFPFLYCGEPDKKHVCGLFFLAKTYIFPTVTKMVHFKQQRILYEEHREIE